MKTRRIYLQPNEVVEVMNQFGTSILKATAMYEGMSPHVVTYEQPGVPITSPFSIDTLSLLSEPLREGDLFVDAEHF